MLKDVYYLLLDQDRCLSLIPSITEALKQLSIPPQKKRRAYGHILMRFLLDNCATQVRQGTRNAHAQEYAIHHLLNSEKEYPAALIQQ